MKYPTNIERLKSITFLPLKILEANGKFGGISFGESYPKCKIDCGVSLGKEDYENDHDSNEWVKKQIISYLEIKIARIKNETSL